MDTIKTNPIIKLALPATIENILQTLVGFVDAFMIAKIGLTAVTAVGIANSILNVYLAVFIALGVGASSLISQNLGAQKKDVVKKLTNQSIILAMSVGLFFGFVSLIFGNFLLSFMGANEATLIYATKFFYLVGGSSVFIALMTVFSSILRATEDTKTPMKISLIVNLINIIIDYFLIFGIGPFPALGVVGTAIGTMISRIIGCYLLFRKVQQSKSPVTFDSFFNRMNYWPLVRLTVPATLERLVMRLGQLVYFGLIVRIGEKVFAAHSIAGNIEAFTYMPAYGLAAAIAVLVGNSIGAKKVTLAQTYAVQAVTYGVITMSTLGVFFFIGAPLFASFFTNDSIAIQQIVIALRIDAFAQPALAISLITTGALQGMGDTKSPLISTAIGIWGIRVTGVWLFSLILNMGIAGVWLSIAIDLYLRSIYLIWKFKLNIKAL